MNNRVSHRVKFDAKGRLLSEQRLPIARANLGDDLVLDGRLTEQLNADYFATVKRLALKMYHPLTGK